MHVKTRVLVFITAVGMVAAACGSSPSETPSVTPPTFTGDIACSVGGFVQFPKAMMDGPQLTREQFAETDTGKLLTSFFQTEEAEGAFFQTARGFSIVSKSLVLTYDGVVPSWYVIIQGDRVTGWGTCGPTLVSGDLIASRWQPAVGWNRNSTVIPIKVEGGACVKNGSNEVTTEITRVDVTEQADRVDVVVWTKEKPLPGGFCAGVGVLLDSEITLSSPLGDRALYNTGFIPPTRADQ
jgi:hypothetical protein